MPSKSPYLKTRNKRNIMVFTKNVYSGSFKFHLIEDVLLLSVDSERYLYVPLIPNFQNVLFAHYILLVCFDFTKNISTV